MLKGTGSQHELFVHDLAKQFFTSKVFSRMEGPLIKFFLYGTDAFNLNRFNPGTAPGRERSMEDRMLEMKAFRFKQGDAYLVWKVVSRESDEILLRWEVGGFQGTTWFHIPSHRGLY